MPHLNNMDRSSRQKKTNKETVDLSDILDEMEL